MSTPSPAGHISLPRAKPYRLTIHNDEHYPRGHSAQLVFSEDKDKKRWIAGFSVANVGLTEDSHVKELEDGQYQFMFTLNNPTLAQKDAGYIQGTYVFTFKPPGTNPADFKGTLNDPWPDDAEDNWTAEGRPPDPGPAYS